MNRNPISGAHRRWVSEDSTGSFRLADLQLPAEQSASAAPDSPEATAANGTGAVHGVPGWTGVIEEEAGEEANG
jgi:hypothetical protein